MSVSGLTNEYNPPTLDGLTIIEADQLYVGGQEVDITTLVPYVGANQTLNMGTQNIQTSHTPVVGSDVVNLTTLTAAVAFVDTANALTYLNKITYSDQTVQSNVSYNGTATFTQKANFNAGVSIKGSPAGSWDIVTEYTDIDYQNLIFSDSTSPTKVITFRGNSGKIACSGLTASKILISDQYQTITASNTDSIKVIYLENVTSDIQTQINLKSDLSYVNSQLLLKSDLSYVNSQFNLKANLSGGNSFSGSQNYNDKTLNTVAIFDASRNLSSSAISTTELTYLSGVTSAIQTQLNNRALTSYVDSQNSAQNTVIGTKSDTSYVNSQNSAQDVVIATKANTSALASYLPLIGGTLTGKLTCVGLDTTAQINIGLVSNIVPFLKSANSSNHYNSTATEAFLFQGQSGSIMIGNSTTRDATTCNLMIGAPSTISEIVSTKSDGSGFLPLNFAASSYFFATGNVGIATTTPTEKLHVFGRAVVANLKPYVYTDLTVVKSSAACSMVIASGGEALDATLYLGTPYDPTTSVGSAYKCAIIAKANGSVTGWSTADLHFCVNGATGSNDYTESAGITHSKMVIKSSTGNVGIGTVTPTEKLTVNGNIKTLGITGTEGIFNTGNTAASSNLVLTLRDNTTIPHKLFFTPNLPAGNYNNNVVLGDFGIFTNYDDGPTGSNAIALGPWNGSNLVRITPTNTQFYGNVGIGLTPTRTLDVSGSTRISADCLVSGVLDVGGDDHLRFSNEGSFRRIQSFGSTPLHINPLGNNIQLGASGLRTTIVSELYLNDNIIANALPLTTQSPMSSNFIRLPLRDINTGMIRYGSLSWYPISYNNSIAWGGGVNFVTAFNKPHAVSAVRITVTCSLYVTGVANGGANLYITPAGLPGTVLQTISAKKFFNITFNHEQVSATRIFSGLDLGNYTGNFDILISAFGSGATTDSNDTLWMDAFVFG